METVTCKTFYELLASGSERIHCLIELEHPVAIDARLCWLQATARACELLHRMPNLDELRLITETQARALTKAVARQRRPRSRVARGTKPGGCRPKTKKNVSAGSQALEARLAAVLKSAAEARATSRELRLKNVGIRRTSQRLRRALRDAWYVSESLRHLRAKAPHPVTQ